ncbi:hypothetical protein [Candidatus Pelagibacter sp. HIMB1709]|uniref:hypothetical protein n=1 Tax=Candidatus Pelagibacter sp. HIMB1709 TaxID=3413367 RepID=UPI003F872887
MFLFQINNFDIMGLKLDFYQVYREGRGIDNYRGFSMNPNVSLAPFYFIILYNLMINNKDRVILFMLLLVSLLTIYTESRVNIFITLVLIFYYFTNTNLKKKFLIFISLLLSIKLFQIYLNKENFIFNLTRYFESLKFKLFSNNQVDTYRFEKWTNAMDNISWNFFGKGFDFYAFKYGFYAENTFLEFIIYFGLIPFFLIIIYFAVYILKNINKINKLYIVSILIFLSLNMGNTFMLIQPFGLFVATLNLKYYEHS